MNDRVKIKPLIQNLSGQFHFYKRIEVGDPGWFHLTLNIGVPDPDWFHFLFSEFHFVPAIEVGDPGWFHFCLNFGFPDTDWVQFYPGRLYTAQPARVKNYLVGCFWGSIVIARKGFGNSFVQPTSGLWFTVFTFAPNFIGDHQ